MTTITLVPDGPILVQADEIVLTEDGKDLAPVKTVALCRCNQSSNKPFCDGSHQEAEKGLPAGVFNVIDYN